ncbi:hypothetical protein IAU59_000430 [Kwoniella sp. CBS 9459]
MSDLLTDNALETQNEQHQQQRPEAVVLSNGTTLVASVDEGAQFEDGAENGGVTEQPKGDLTKITSGDGQDVKILPEGPNPNGAEDEAIGSLAEAEKASPTDAQEATVNASDDNQESYHTTTTESQSAPTIAEPPLSDARPSPASPIVRAATPSSRTSTPPLGAHALAKKKFSSVNVNQKFLSKAGSPAPTAGPTKISSLNAASPVPIASTSSRLLSTKLTTVPSNKSSASPNLPGSSSASSSPWAKPVLPLPTGPIIEPETPAPAPSAPAAAAPPTTTTTLHQPAPMRARVLGTTTTPPVMGTGLGIAASAPKPAWKSVLGGEPRKPATGITRDFPTAMEVAEGKKAAQLAAQAQAAHNQAILQGLNAFTQLDPNAHRWDEEDEEDDVIDFGDGLGEHHHQGEGLADGLLRDGPAHDQPVAKSDRFAEDFDRSWPRRPQPQQQDMNNSRDHGGYPPPRRQEGEGSRTLFNASSNRLEPRQPPPQAPQVQPTRLMSRPTDGGGPTRQPPPHLSNAGRAGFDRPLPPHLQGGGPGSAAAAAAEGSGRMLPPHMAGNSAQQQPSAPPPARSAWGGMNRNTDRAPPPHLPPTERSALPPQSTVFEQHKSPEKPFNNLPPRRSFSHAGPPPIPPHQPSQPEIEAPNHQQQHQQHPPPSVGADEQAAEMHTAAEKARLRRLAEESEREAAAERARQKARELEERFNKTKDIGTSEAKVEVEPTRTAAPPPEPSKPAPQITLASRPKPPHAHALATATSHLPPRPDSHDRTPQPPPVLPPPSRSAEASWRNRMQSQPESVLPDAPPARTSVPVTSLSSPPLNHHARPTRPTAESFFDATPDEASRSFSNHHDAAAHPTKEANFDSMLARIQAAMAEARSVPEAEALEEEEEILVSQVLSSASPEKPSRPALVVAVQEFFDVTYPEPPRSPPPAWRSYHVRVPKVQPTRPLVPISRLRAAEAPRSGAPAGFFSTFSAAPATAPGIAPTLTRAEVLLPQPVLRRFQRSEPIVSISPRRLEPFEKKPKKKPGALTVARSEEEPSANNPIEAASSLLPSSDALKSQQLRNQRARADDWRQAESFTTVAEKPQPPAAAAAAAVPDPPVDGPPRKIKSPVKTSAAARAEREGRFATDGVTIGAAPGISFADKPGVRFMVSSELEGDSLLDEVNKMSLESVGEGDDKEQDARSGESVKLSGAETPQTPPVPRPSSPNTSSWPKAPLSYPASHSPARSVSQQHDQDAIRFVWDTTQQTAAQKQTAENNNSLPTPMYPSLNAPSSADPPAAQPLPSGSSMKMSFSNSQTFSSPGGSGPSLSAPNSYVNVHRAPSAPSPYSHYASPQTTASPDIQSHNVMGLSYSNMGNARAGATGGFQQGVWSPTAFGTSLASPGYSAYAAQHSHHHQQQSQHQQHQQKTSMDPKSPVGMSYNGKAAEGMAYGGGYQQSTYPQQQQQLQQQQQQQQQQHYSAASYGRGVTNPAHMYAYGYGAPGQLTRPVSGRFAAQANGGDYATTQPQAGYMSAEASQGGYYGGVAQNQATYPTANYQYQQQPQGHGAVGQGGRGGMGGARKMW